MGRVRVSHKHGQGTSLQPPWGERPSLLSDSGVLVHGHGQLSLSPTQEVQHSARLAGA